MLISIGAILSLTNYIEDISKKTNMVISKMTNKVLVKRLIWVLVK